MTKYAVYHPEFGCYTGMFDGEADWSRNSRKHYESAVLFDCIEAIHQWIDYWGIEYLGSRWVPVPIESETYDASPELLKQYW